MRARRLWLFRSAALATSLIATLAVLEVATRVIQPIDFFQVRGATETFCEHDSLLGWRLRPNAAGRFAKRDFDCAVSINSAGFRDREFPVRKPAGARRIAILGDSMTWGFGVDNDSCFAKVLERSLAGRPGWEVLNFGTIGYGTDQEFLLLREVAAAYEPDVVVVAYNPNDLLNNMTAAEHGYAKPYFRPTPEGLVLSGVPVPRLERSGGPWKMGPVGRWLLDHSELYAFLRVRLDFLFVRFGALSVLGRAGGYAAVLSGTEGTSVTLALMDSVFATARAHGAQPVLLLTSSPGIVTGAVPGDLFQRKLGPHAGQRDVPVLDMLPVLKGAGAPAGRLFWPHDGHWTPEGHRIAGEALARFLEERGIVGGG